MKDDVDELARLFDEGKKAYDHLDKLYNAIVPTRSETDMPEISIDTNNSFGLRIPTMRYPVSEPEHDQTVKVLKSAKTFVDKWIADVNVLLERLGKTRYKIQFNDPEWKIGANNRDLLGTNTRNEEALSDILTDFDLRLDELRRIILDYEKNLEQALHSSNEPIEPAAYDPKTRTIFFAEEAIRFKKDAPFTPALCDVVFSKPDKLWTLKELQTIWDDLYEYLGNERPSDWHRVYEAFNRLNERVRKATGIDDLFVFSTKSVRLNKKYLAK